MKAGFAGNVRDWPLIGHCWVTPAERMLLLPTARPNYSVTSLSRVDHALTTAAANSALASPASVLVILVAFSQSGLSVPVLNDSAVVAEEDSLLPTPTPRYMLAQQSQTSTSSSSSSAAARVHAIRRAHSTPRLLNTIRSFRPGADISALVPSPRATTESAFGDEFVWVRPKGRAQFECNICFDAAKDPVVTQCGHLYCWSCLHQVRPLCEVLMC